MLTLLRRDVMHHVGDHDQTVIMCQLRWIAGKNSLSRETGLHLANTVLRNIEAIKLNGGKVLLQKAGEQTDTAAEIEYLAGKVRGEQPPQVARLVFREIAGILAGNSKRLVEHLFVVAGKAIKMHADAHLFSPSASSRQSCAECLLRR